MAIPAIKLRQSSLRSFLVLHPPASAASDYELLRQDRICRNREFFKNLGIEVPASAPESKPKSKPKPPRPYTEPTLPLRRSARKRPAPSVFSEEQESTQTREDGLENPDEHEYVDSAVFGYASESIAKMEASPRIAQLGPPISEYKVVGRPLRDPLLTKIYTMDVCSPTSGHPNRLLVAAGGHDGFISVFGTEVAERREGEEGSEHEASPSLMYWKGSKSWLSTVSFIKDYPMLLISSSNDGGLIIWDIGKQSCLSSSSPPEAGELKTLHSNGIFSMDQGDGVIATASKDSSVAVTRIAGTGELVNEWRTSGHHSGAIRGVRFRNTKEIIADCGADGRICVLDTRVPQPCTISIDSDHTTGVNTVEWSPANEFLLLSASKDPALLLYDIRNSIEPVHKLRGHAESNVKTCYQIYRPAFIDNGLGVATPGQGSRKISVYNIESGKLISQSAIGYDANLVFYHLGGLGQQRLWAAGRQINQLYPVKLSHKRLAEP